MSKTLEWYEGSTISLYGCSASGAYALGPEEEEDPSPLGHQGHERNVRHGFNRRLVVMDM
jgi:hypothetical protein